MIRLTLEKRVEKLERLLKLESVSLSKFDCEDIVDIVNKEIKKLNMYCDLVDDNADYGLINIGIASDDEYVTDYDIEAVEYNKFNIKNDNRNVGTVKSYDLIGKTIASDLSKKFV